jgi:hypothetical protein
MSTDQAHTQQVGYADPISPQAINQHQKQQLKSPEEIEEKMTKHTRFVRVLALDLYKLICE